MVDDGGEVGGTVEFDLRETRPVRLHHTFDPCGNTADNPMNLLPDCLPLSKGAAVS